MTSAPNDKAHFCPRCASASIVVSQLVGSDARCEICGWTGPSHELATFHFSHDFSSPDAVANAFFLDIRQLLSVNMCVSLGRLLMKWGFLDSLQPQILARYVAAVAKAIATALIQERQQVEKEKVHGSA
jgi:hypothetical protein